MCALLGKQVKTVLSHDPLAVAQGQLLSFSEDGEVVLLDDCGIKHYCWPNLETVLDET